MGWGPRDPPCGSRIYAGPDAEIEAFRTRSLAQAQFPHVFCDAAFCDVGVGAHMASQALVVTTGVAIDGIREVLWAPPSVTASLMSSGASSCPRRVSLVSPGS